MLHLSFHKHTSVFKTPGGTSRGILETKDSWIIELWSSHDSETIGTGEVSIIEKLSIDDPSRIEPALKLLKELINKDPESIPDFLSPFPAIQFGLETALLDLKKGGHQILFPSNFTRGKTGIPINGLVWMGDFASMHKQLKEKLEAGFTCIKIKVGAIDFEQELSLLKQVRNEFKQNEIEIRVDANGAFAVGEAEEKLKRLSEYQLHSIEQPIKAGHWEAMARLCELDIIPIALDEELIGNRDNKAALLDSIDPPYIILKPSLLGGLTVGDEWIKLAEERNIGWWATSALETNIGLNAIAQWTVTKNNPMPQGLGTGQLFTNNFESPLQVKNGELWYLDENI